MAENNNNAFAPGFMLGLFSGVVGYYFFGTKQGEKTRKKIAQEWDRAQEYLASQEILGDDNQFSSLGDLVNFAKDELLKKLEVEVDKPKKVKLHRVKRTYRRRIKQKQFKGV